MRRRDFLTAAPAATTLCAAGTAPKPNILWITCEDLSPVLGCYGDADARTPNLDRLAGESVRYTNAFSPAPVCSPSRSCLITGVMANTLGSMNLRGMVAKPATVPCFPELLRKAGYYTSNNVKTDYNFDVPAGCWDETSNRAHWRKRTKAQPFFSVFNLMETHQGEIRYSAEELAKQTQALPPNLRQDPGRVKVPPYFPDTPAVRQQLAVLHTQVTRMDQKVGAILRELEQDGLAPETIVFFFSDHGTGLPRGKRFLNDTGLRVPMMVRFPERFRGMAPSPAGSTTDRLVSFLDFAPTVLSLASVQAAPSMQGTAFLGPLAGRRRTIAFAARDRVDEEIECSRTAFDGRWQYIRHYYPHRPVLQHGDYSDVAPVWKELRRLDAAGKLTGAPAALMAPTKPAEELFDLRSDPQQLRNLAGDPAHAKRMHEMRTAMIEWMTRMRDAGMLPEADMRRRAGGNPPASLTDSQYPVSRVIAAAERVGRGMGEWDTLLGGLRDSDAAVRYWSVVGLTVLGKGKEALIPLCSDPSAPVQVAAAEAVLRQNGGHAAEGAYERALRHDDACVRLQAAASLWHLGSLAKPLLPALRASLTAKTEPEYQWTYFEWAAKKTLQKYGS